MSIALAAGEALAKLGPAAQPAVPDLIELLGSDHGQHIRAAVTAIEQIGPGAAPAVSALVEYYRKQEGKAPYAARALAAIGPAAGTAVEALEEYSQGNGWCEAATIYALFCIRGDEGDLQALTDLLWDGEEKYGRPYAAQLLDKLGTAARPVEARVREWLKDGKHEAMRAHLESLLEKLTK